MPQFHYCSCTLLPLTYSQTSVFERFGVRTIRFSNKKFEIITIWFSNGNSILDQLKSKINLNQRDKTTEETLLQSNFGVRTSHCANNSLFKRIIQDENHSILQQIFDCRTTPDLDISHDRVLGRDGDDLKKKRSSRSSSVENVSRPANKCLFIRRIQSFSLVARVSWHLKRVCRLHKILSGAASSPPLIYRV